MLDAKDAAPVEIDDRVSCQVLEAMFIACEQKDIDVDWVLETVSFDRAHLQKRTNYIDWSSMVEISTRIATRLTDQEVLELAEASYEYPVYRIWRLIGLLKSDLFGFYMDLFGEKGPVAKFYPIRVKILRSEPLLRQIIVQYVVPEELEPCELIFKVLEGQAIGISRFLGYNRSQVQASYTERKVVLDIRLPRETGFWPKLRRILLFPFSWWRSIGALQQTQETLIQLQSELSEESNQLAEEREHSRLVQKQLNLVMGNQAVMLWTLNLSMEMVYVSESTKKFLGYTVDEMLALPQFATVAQENHQAISEMFSEYISLEASGQPFMGTDSIRLLRIRKDGSTFWSENYVSFLRDETGVAQGMVGFSVDVSDLILKEAQSELLEQQVQNLRQKEVVSLVAGGIAHDFNNSLQGIIGFAEMALDPSVVSTLPDNVVVLQNQILKSAGSAAELVKKLLALSSQQTLTRKVINAKLWLDEFVPMAHSILGKEIELLIVADESDSIYADSLQLERALINLMMNAKDSMEGSGRLTIRCLTVESSRIDTLAGDDEDRQFVELSVEDTGAGISELDLVRIFDPFFTLKESQNGTGLGLAVTAGIVDQHEGYIRASNLESGGAAIQMYFPLHHEVNFHPGSDTASFSCERLRILLVDDDDNVRELCRSFLEAEGAIVTEANSGENAILDANKQNFDLIVMDVLMPGITGNLAARKIRLENPGQPILFVTGYAGSKEVLDDLTTEVVLPKPFRKVELVEAVQRVMQR